LNKVLSYKAIHLLFEYIILISQILHHF